MIIQQQHSASGVMLRDFVSHEEVLTLMLSILSVSLCVCVCVCQAQHVFSPVMQGNARMMAPPTHGQPSLVSSSTTQYPEQTHTMYGTSGSDLPSPLLFASCFHVFLF